MKPSNRGKLFNIVLPTLLIASFGVFITATFHRLNADETVRRTEVVSSNVAERLRNQFDAQISVLNGISAFWLSSQEVTAEEFANYAAIVFEDSSAIISLQWVDPENIVRYLYPLEGENLKAVGMDNNKFPNRLEPIVRAKELRGPVMTRPLFLVQGFPGVVIYVPIYRGEEYLGAAVGVMRLSELFREFKTTVPYNDYDILIATEDVLLRGDGAAIYTTDGDRVTSPSGDTVTDPAAPRVPADFDRKAAPLFIADRQLSVSAALRRSGPPEYTIALGLVTAAIVLLCAFFLAAIDRKRDELERTVTRERDFASLVSHQLRAPLTELNWMTDVLDEPDTDPKERTKTIADMRSIVRQGVHLVADLLSISRIERGVLQLKKEDTPVATIIEDVLAPIRESAKARGVTFHIDVPPSLTVNVDTGKTAEAIRNIVDNAVKYGPEGGTVDISASLVDDTVSVTIRDRGPGIPADIKDRIFDKASTFAKKGTTDGAGLGLYLSKMLIELMGGNIRFDTSSKGTVFTISLPTSEKKTG